MASRWRGVVSGEDVTTKRRGNNDKHKHFLVVLDRLKDNELAIEKRESVLTDVVAVGKVEAGDINLSERGRGGQAVKEELSIGVLLVSRGPVERRWNRPGTRDSADKRAGYKFGRQIGGINGSKEMDIDEMIDKVGAEVERAASG
jgi:hypothetical protein